MKSLVLLYNGINGAFSSSASGPGQINLGLLAISSTLKEAGFKVLLLPSVDSCEGKDILKKNIKKALFVGVSCMTGDPLSNAIRLSKAVKECSPKTPIVWGGFHATIDYKNTIEEKYIDFVVRGQGEVAVVELARALQKKSLYFGRIKGLVYKKKGKIVINPVRSNCSIDNYPFLDYDLYFDTYKNVSRKSIIYCSSRGCPYQCTFCSVSNLYHRQYLKYSTPRLFSDLENIVKKYQPESIFFWDDNFFVDLRRVDSYLKWYTETKQTFKWSAFSRVTEFAEFDKAYIEKFKASNCVKMHFGAESGSEKILKMVKKDIKLGDIVKSCRNLTRFGIVSDYTFISGFPKETQKDLEKTLGIIRKILSINVNSGVRLFSFTPSPGIPILKDCVAAGFVVPTKLSEWRYYEYHSFIAPWITPQHQSLIKSLVWITAFCSEASLIWPSNYLLKIATFFLHYDAMFRLRFNFFYFPVEWLYLYSVYKKHYTQKGIEL